MCYRPERLRRWRLRLPRFVWCWLRSRLRAIARPDHMSMMLTPVLQVATAASRASSRVAATAVAATAATAVATVVATAVPPSTKG
ncbi:hypothetical protein OH77DRAFT_1424020 [Trametes cingulata]|nr:hypothetical protein OH77DRAFT_1424020 [Trametes cingulata]